MSKIERRFIPNDSCPVEVEMRDDKPKSITGYAAVFYVEGEEGTEYELFPGLRERIMPRAFNRALKDKDDVRGLFNHDPNKILGRTASKTMKIWKDQKGLRYEIDPPNSSEGASAVESIRRGDVSGSSFAFTVDDDGQKFRRIQNEDGSTLDIREIHSVSMLYDVGPVVYPAFTGASVGVRAASSDLTEVRSAYDSWKKSQDDEAAAAVEAEARAKAAKEALDAKLAAIKERADKVQV